MRSSTDIFGPVEENSDENIEEEEQEEEEELEEEQEEEEPEEEETSSSEDEEADDGAEPDPWLPLRQKVGEGINETYLKEVQGGKSQHYAENAAFNALLPVSRRRLRRTYLERLKWTHHIKHDAIHRKVMKTLRRFIEEDDMDFDEAAESAVAKRKFLLNRLMKKKLLPDDATTKK